MRWSGLCACPWPPESRHLTSFWATMGVSPQETLRKAKEATLQAIELDSSHLPCLFFDCRRLPLGKC